MKKVMLFFLTLVIPTSLFSQNNYLSIDVKSYLRKNNFDQIIPFYNAEKNETAIVLREYSDLTLLLVDSTNNVEIFEDGMAPKIKPQFWAGVSYYKNKYTVYSFNPSKSVLGFVLFDLENRITERESNYIDLKRGEKVLNYFSYNNSFYILSIFEKSSKLNLIRYEDGMEQERSLIELNDDDFPHFLSNNLYNCVYFDDAHMRSSDIYTPIVNSNTSDYTEIQNGNIYIVSNTNTIVSINIKNLETNVITFPINSRQHGESLKGSIFKNFVKQPKTKSCVVDGYFFRSNIFRSNIDIEMYEISSGNLVMETALNPFLEEINGFKNAKLLENDVDFEIIFKSLIHGKLNFSVHNINDEFRVRLGKKSSPNFWNKFDEAFFRTKSNNKFVGSFYDQRSKLLNFNLHTPLFFEKNEERRFIELGVKKNGQLINLKNEEENLNRFYEIEQSLPNPLLNALFYRKNIQTFIYLNNSNSTINFYD